MQAIRINLSLIVVFALLFLAGCVRLCEQRITWRHDQAADTLYVLIHYDGVHDSGDDQNGNGPQQLARFIAEDEILVMDWPFHVQLAEIRALAKDPTLEPEGRALGKAVAEQVKVESAGYYRDANGRIGGAQLVTITKAAEFIHTVNAAINATALKEGFDESFAIDYPGTHELFLSAMESGHQWLTLDGQALRMDVPVQPSEWAVIKAKWAYDEIKTFADHYAASSEEKRTSELENVANAMQMLADVPFSLSESDGVVSLRIGDPAKPTPIRLRMRDDYQPNLVAEVVQGAGKELDALVAKALLADQAAGEAAPQNAYLAAIAEWGPIEELVRAVARTTEAEDEAQSQAAYRWLNKFRIGWNHAHNLPAAPVPEGDVAPAEFGQACLAWCREMRRFPDPREATDSED